MEIVKQYGFDEAEYTLYRAASGDYCVSVDRFFDGDRKDYNCGTLEKAYEFILSHFEMDLEGL